MSRQPSLARRLWRGVEPIHAVTYFSPEPRAALADTGYKGFWMGYFAGRAAPLGAAGPELVRALFYNFADWKVRRALPDAWSFAPPAAALEARARGSAQALRRAFGAAGVGADTIATGAALARRAAESAAPEGRGLFGANLDLPWPDEPIDVLWHAATLLREHRGDGHVALLTAAGVAGREANVLQAAAGIIGRDLLAVARDYDDEEWDALSAGLVERGLLDPSGALTPGGRALKQDIEDRTDTISLTAYDVLDDEAIDQLLGVLGVLGGAVLASGDIPPVTPIGARFDG